MNGRWESARRQGWVREVHRALIVTPWMPQYRRPFFEQLRSRLAAAGIELNVAYGRPDPELAQRRDTEELQGGMPLHQRSLRFGRREISQWTMPNLAGVDLVIVEQAIRHVALYRAIAARPERCALALWGHGRTYTKPVSRIEGWLKKQVTLRADWFFAYTEGGRRHITSYGFPEERVTVVQNSQPMPQESLVRQSLERGREPATGLFIGGIDESKRIDLLLAASRRIRERVPGFRLVIGGRGAQEHLVRAAAAEHEWIEYVGFVDSARKSELAHRATVMLMPGRVGLIVIDAMVYGLPLITTRYPYHAPELEYLIDTGNVVITEEDPSAYAHAVANLLGDRSRIQAVADDLRGMAATYTLDAMVANFAEGVQRAISAGRRR